MRLRQRALTLAREGLTSTHPDEGLTLEDSVNERSGDDMRDADEASHEVLDEEASTPHVAPDAPEADALEQAMENDGPPSDDRNDIPADVPEADALEQRTEVGDGEDYDRS